MKTNRLVQFFRNLFGSKDTDVVNPEPQENSTKEEVAQHQEVEGSTKKKNKVKHPSVLTKPRELWLLHGRDIPKGMVIYNNGDRNHYTIHDLECITRGELLKRNNDKKRSGGPDDS